MQNADFDSSPTSTTNLTAPAYYNVIWGHINVPAKQQLIPPNFRMVRMWQIMNDQSATAAFMMQCMDPKLLDQTNDLYARFWSHIGWNDSNVGHGFVRLDN